MDDNKENFPLEETMDDNAMLNESARLAETTLLDETKMLDETQGDGEEIDQSEGDHMKLNEAARQALEVFSLCDELGKADYRNERYRFH